MRLSVGRWVRKRTFISASSTLDNVERERPQQGKKKIRPSPPTVFSLAARLQYSSIYKEKEADYWYLPRALFALSLT
jgi:hypothetical protein